MPAQPELLTTVVKNTPGKPLLIFCDKATGFEGLIAHLFNFFLQNKHLFVDILIIRKDNAIG